MMLYHESREHEMTAETSSDPTTERGFNSDLSKYLEVSMARYRACISVTEYPLSLVEPKASVSFQYVKLDPNSGEPKFDVLAKVLTKHIVGYSLSVRTRQSVRRRIDYNEDEGELYILAREYFRKIHDSGEVGELLLFFLLEAVFGAPQAVCKMELKDSPNEEVKGTDGIHVKWDCVDTHLDVYLGESKLYKDISDALKSVFESLAIFYDEGRLDRELHLVTSHFKYLDAHLQRAVLRFINRETSETECHIMHACLVGWDWADYGHLVTDRRVDFITHFEQHYQKYAKKIEAMLNRRFAKCRHKHITYRFLFLPFKSVDEFRRAFYKELCGVDIGSSDH